MVELFRIFMWLASIGSFPLLVDLLNAFFPKVPRLPPKITGYWMFALLNTLLVLVFWVWWDRFLPYYKMVSKPSRIQLTIHVVTCCFFLFKTFYHFYSTQRTEPGFVYDNETFLIFLARTKEDQEGKNLEHDKCSVKNEETEAIHRKNINIKDKEESESVIETPELIDNPDKKKQEYYCKRCDYKSTIPVFHCKICNGCINQHDHHCPFVTQCIGSDNQRHFLMFLFYLFLGDCYAMYMTYQPFLNCYMYPTDQTFRACDFLGSHQLLFLLTLWATVPFGWLW